MKSAPRNAGTEPRGATRDSVADAEADADAVSTRLAGAGLPLFPGLSFFTAVSDDMPTTADTGRGLRNSGEARAGGRRAPRYRYRAAARAGEERAGGRRAIGPPAEPVFCSFFAPGSGSLELFAPACEVCPELWMPKPGVEPSLGTGTGSTDDKPSSSRLSCSPVGSAFSAAPSALLFRADPIDPNADGDTDGDVRQGTTVSPGRTCG